MALRIFLQVILFCLFIYTVSKAFKNWMSEFTELYIEYETKTTPIPSITICPFVPNLNHHHDIFVPGQNQTMIDFMEAVEPLSKSIIEARLTLWNDYKTE